MFAFTTSWICFFYYYLFTNYTQKKRWISALVEKYRKGSWVTTVSWLKMKMMIIWWTKLIILTNDKWIWLLAMKQIVTSLMFERKKIFFYFFWSDFFASTILFLDFLLLFFFCCWNFGWGIISFWNRFWTERMIAGGDSGDNDGNVDDDLYLSSKKKWW